MLIGGYRLSLLTFRTISSDAEEEEKKNTAVKQLTLSIVWIESLLQVFFIRNFIYGYWAQWESG